MLCFNFILWIGQCFDRDVIEKRWANIISSHHILMYSATQTNMLRMRHSVLLHEKAPIEHIQQIALLELASLFAYYENNRRGSIVDISFRRNLKLNISVYATVAEWQIKNRKTFARKLNLKQNERNNNDRASNPSTEKWNGTAVSNIQYSRSSRLIHNCNSLMSFT